MAVLGIEAEHATAEATVEAMALSDIVVGFPTEIFVSMTVPASVRALAGGLSYSGPDRRASASLRNALETAKGLLTAGGFTLNTAEWPTVDSPTLGSVNALYHMLSGFEYEPGSAWTYSVCAQTFTGQIAQWQHNYLLANTTTIGPPPRLHALCLPCAMILIPLTPCSVPSVAADVIDDTRPVGLSHGPAGCFRGYNGNTGESKLRYCGVYQTEAPEFWNMCCWRCSNPVGRHYLQLEGRPHNQFAARRPAQVL